MKRTSSEIETVLESLEETNEDLTYLLGQLRTSLLLEKLCPGVFQHGKCRTEFNEDAARNPRFFIYRGDVSPPEIFPMEEVPEEFILVEAEKRGITGRSRPGDGNVGMNGPVGKWIHVWMLSREESKRRHSRRIKRRVLGDPITEGRVDDDAME